MKSTLKLWTASICLLMTLTVKGQTDFTYTQQRLPSNIESVTQLSDWLTVKYGFNCILSPVDTQKTSFSQHVLFKISIQNTPLHHGWVKWNRFGAQFTECSFPLLKQITRSDAADPDSALLERFTKPKTSIKTTLSPQIQWVNNEGVMTKHWVIRVESLEEFREVILWEDGSEWSSTDLIVHDIEDTLVATNIFLPDPITSARASYGGAYVDDGDQNSDVLTEELIEADIPLRWNADSNFWELVSDHFVADDITPPNVRPPSIADVQLTDLRMDRSNVDFEYFNAYYHLIAVNALYESLGFEVIDFPLHFDAHGTEADQSSYVPSDIFPYLKFGDGGVDDAEDAEVIVHEYGHAVIHSIAPNTSFGEERKALDEGMCDYFALSYASRHSDYNRTTLFDWDGHNEYWEGRTLTDTRTYPTDKSYNIYGDGILWASALAEIADFIGADETDRLALYALYSWFPNMLLSDAAALVVQSDSIFNGSLNRDIISAVFCARGLLPGCEDTLISTTPLTQPYLGNSYDFAFNHEPLFIYPNKHNIIFLEVLDLKGSIVYMEEWNASDRTFYPWDISMIPQGVFIIRLRTNTESYSFKVVKLW
ncbi:MAG: hypothetical protein RLP15_08055 [Cryomorphaceae bacterium]